MIMYLLDTNIVSELRKAKTGKADKGYDNDSFNFGP